MTDLGKPIDISIPLDFYGRQVNAFAVESATSRAVETGEMVGDTRRGGSCNFEQIKLIPHCNGTHTECVGHITHERFAVRDCLRHAFVAARLVSVEPVSAAQTNDTYAVEFGEGDRVISRAVLEQVLQNAETAALIVRTLPNSDQKLARQYNGDEIPPYFSSEAMEFIIECGVKHLLVDLPSIDRMLDAGKLSNHRIFWNVELGKFEINSTTRMNATITELIFVPDDVSDGVYMLNLQIAPFMSDASPSRPLLFPYEPSDKLKTEK